MNATPAGRKIALDVCNRGEPKVQIKHNYFQIGPLEGSKKAKGRILVQNKNTMQSAGFSG
jgi:hypothetical protein